MTFTVALILALYVLAALLPIVALVRNVRAHRKVTSEHEGYGLSDYYHSPEGVAAERAARVSDLLLVGGGVVLASVAGALSLF